MHTGTGSGGRNGVAQAIDELDLGALGRALWRKKVLIGGLTLLAAALAFAAVNSVTPRYRSEARVLIETRENIFLRPEAERAERAATVDHEAVTSQVQLILSRKLALDVIRKLRLAEKPEFDPVLRGPSVMGTLLGLTGLIKDPMSQTPEERVLRSYMDRLVAYQVDKSRVIAIEFESQDPELAAQIVNAIADGLLVLQQVARLEQTREAAQFLAAEIEKLRQSVAEAEAKVEQYRATTNLMIGTNNTTLSGQQLGDINAQVAAARAQKADAESKARIIRDALGRGVATDVSDIMNSELLRRLSEQHMTLRAQLAEQSSTLLSQHPRIKELRAQIADLERQIRLEAERMARAFENDAAGAAARLQSLSATLDQLKQQAASSNVQDVKLRSLEREAKSQRDLLESWLGKYREAAARDTIGASSPEARIISRGIVSTVPSWPKKLPTVLIAAFGMFTLMAGFVVSGQLMNGAMAIPNAVANPMSAPAPATEMAMPPVVATMPSATSPKAATKPLPAAPRYESSPSSAGRVKPDDLSAAVAAKPEPSSGQSLVARLRAKLARATAAQDVAAATPSLAGAVSTTASISPRAAAASEPVGTDNGVPTDAIDGLAKALGAADEGGRRIAMVGTRRNMGTTLASISLARALARQGRTILVDLALASPNLSVIASDPNAPGLYDLVGGAASFGQVITRDRYSRVHLIMLGKGDLSNEAMLTSQRLAITIEALSRSYDYVVLDAGALPTIAAEQVAKLASRAVLVADDLDGAATESARSRLLSAGFPTVSVLVSTPDGPEFNAGGTRAAA
ncbi:MAG: lipopolysaccharide biosynthesis protein [Hyphomicrobiales bacterium]|nr:lipopolysaccharide biosynthesis protein [Hyphomicrobiales bacterium]